VRGLYDTSISFDSNEGDTPVGQFYQKMKTLQAKVLEDAVTNSKLWFGKAKMSPEVAEAMMYPILKFPKHKDGPDKGEPDESKPATIKLKVPYWEGKFNVELYNMNKKQIFGPDVETEKTPMDLIPSRSHMKGLMQCSGVWFAGGRFGVTWNLVQAQVRPPVRIRGFCMMDDSDDEGALKKVEAFEAAEAASADDDEPDTPAAAAPKKKKKVVRKKKKG